MSQRYVVNGKYSKSAAQSRPKTFCICPDCGSDAYAVAVHTSRRNYNSIHKALPIRYCFKCNQIVFLEKMKVVWK